MEEDNNIVERDETHESFKIELQKFNSVFWKVAIGQHKARNNKETGYTYFSKD